MYALVDAVSFFASSEKVFRPDLCKKPVAVLSNNDGCIIARSPEVKALGIPMGAPYFKYKQQIQRHNIHIFSANFELYGDLSRRMMKTLETFTPDIEIYSIDEAFLEFSNSRDWKRLGKQIKQRVHQWTGLPVSVGFGRTKTLAKLANHLSKRIGSSVFCIHDYDEDKVLSTIGVKDIWGIGRQHTKWLHKHGIRNVKQFKHANSAWITKNLHIPGAKTQRELWGDPCMALEQVQEPKKSIISSRTFGKRLTSLDQLKGAVADNIHLAAEKLRKEEKLCQRLMVYIRTNPHEEHSYSKSAVVSLPEPTDSTIHLTTATLKTLESLFKEDLRYMKSGVMLFDLSFKHHAQKNLFQTFSPQHPDTLMTAIDTINSNWGRHTIKLARIHTQQRPWKMNQNHRSPGYTTKWSDLPVTNTLKL